MDSKENIVTFLKNKDYVMVNDNLGSGSFGKTVLLKDPFIDELFVAKKYSPYHEEDQKIFYANFLQEIKLMFRLFHKNVVRIFDYYPYPDHYTGYIIMEYIEGVSISKFFERELVGNSFFRPENIFIQLIEAFQCIEESGIVHRDIRESNIMVEDDGTVKIIDFGLGKVVEAKEYSEDSLVLEINRTGLDSLPNEFWEGNYTSLTDMFYLGELFNRLLKKHNLIDRFSYTHILNKMMMADMRDRFKSFSEIKDAMGKKDFEFLEVSEDDKNIYLAFSDSLKSSIAYFTGTPNFIKDINIFTQRLKWLIEVNKFEYQIQNKNDFIQTVVAGKYSYYSNANIAVEDVVNFFNWFSNLTEKSKQLVLRNIVTKLFTIKTKFDSEDEVPF